MINFKNYKTRVILVDDEPSELDGYRFLLQSMGVRHIIPVQDSRVLMPVVEGDPDCVVFLDLNMPHKPGQEVLAEIRERSPETPVIICTANSDIEMAVECLKKGAHDYLVKPINLNTFGSALRNAFEICSLRNEVMTLKGVPSHQKLNHPDCFSHIITNDPVIQGLFRYVESIAASGQPVLVLGETGSGKELFAKAIHDAGRFEGNFIAVDVSGLDDTLFSDTLFGHEKGAYTGADLHRSGLIEKAAGGTIFLDEIGDLNRVSQIKLLRLLQEGTYYPLGSDHPRQCKARIITAANKKLNTFSDQEDGFRMDLYYRLSTHLIQIPPLRERKGDIALLAVHLKNQAAQSMGKKIPQISAKSLALLENHPFPGNVRELKSYIYDVVAQCNTDILSDDLIMERLSMEASASPSPSAASLSSSSPDEITLESLIGRFPTLSELAEYAVDAALNRTNGNQSRAAGLLGISKQALSKRLKKRKKDLN